MLATVLAAGAVALFVREAQTFGAANLDAAVYRDAARAFLHGADVYSGRFDGLPFTYPPFALIAFAPLAMLPSWLAALAVFLLSSAALVATVRWCQTYALAGRPVEWWTTVALAATAAMGLEPLRSTFQLGQVNLVLLALVLGVDARATRWSGAGAGIAAAIKVTPALLVLAQAVRGDLASVRRGALALVAATVVGAALAPSATVHYFGSLLWDANRPGALAHLQNQSLRGMVERHLPGHGTALWLLAVAAVLLLGAWVVRVHRRDAFASLAAAAITGLLVSPISWSHHWVWVLPAVAVGMRAGRRSPLLWASVALVVATIATDVLWLAPPAPLAAQDLYVVTGVLWLVAAAVTAGSARRVQPLPPRPQSQRSQHSQHRQHSQPGHRSGDDSDDALATVETR